MAASRQVSLKQIKIDKDNKAMMIAIGVASFLVIFALTASKTLYSYYGYQNRVIKAKKEAVSQLKSDVSSVSNLNSSYEAFISTPQNVLDQSSFGTGFNQGNNAKIILDALPSSYDFPGLASSIENLFANQPYTLSSVSGTDNQLTQQGIAPSLKPTAQAIPINLDATGSYSSLVVGTSTTSSFLDRLQLSIRPFQIQSIDLSGSDNNLTTSVSATTYFQPGVSFQISKENVQ